MANTERNNIIQYGYDKGLNSQQIGEALKQGGYNPLSRYEQAKINSRTLGKNVILEEGKNFTTGLGTILGTIGEAINPNSEAGKAIRDNIKEQVPKAILNYGKGVLQGDNYILEDVANIILDPYNLSVEKIAKDPLGSIPSGLAYAAANPINTTFDVLSVGGGKLAGAGLRAITPKGGKLERIVKTIAPSATDKAVRETINLTPSVYSKSNKEIISAINEIAEGDVKSAVKNLQTGEWVKGSEEVTRKLSNLSDRFEKELRNLGLDPAEMKNTAVRQNILEEVDPTREYGITADAIKKAIEKPTKSNLEKINIADESTLNTLRQRAENLYDTGAIKVITQRGLNSGTGSTVNRTTRGLASERLVGNATIDQIADNLLSGYTQLQKEINSAKIARDSVTEIAEKFGRKISPNDIDKVAKGETIISPREFKEGITTAFKSGAGSRTGEILAGTVNKLPDLKKYSNDLYVINKNDLLAVARKAGFRGKSNALLDTLYDAARIPLSLMKSSVLTSLPYIAQNRIGNFILNSLGGVGLQDYSRFAKRFFTGELGKDIPDYLRTSTSFHGLADNLMDTSLLTSMRNELRGARELAKTIGEQVRAGENLNALGNTARLIGYQAPRVLTQPIFNIESTFELADRMNAYYKAARDEAGRLGITTAKVLSNARTDNKLQRRLIQKVNDTLGDYINPNPYLDSNVQQLLNTVLPFNKIVTTSATVTGNQLANNPLGFYAGVRLPARLGTELNTRQLQTGQPSVTEGDTRGGLIINPAPSRRFPAVARYGAQYPIQATVETLVNAFGNPEEAIPNQLSYMSGFFNALQGKNNYGNYILPPNSYEVNGRLITLDNNGNPIEIRPSITAGLTNYISKNFLPIATLWNKSLAPSVATLLGQDYYQPSGRSIFGTIGEAHIPFLYESDTSKAPLRTTGDNLLNQLGFRTRDIYYDRNNITPSDMNAIRNIRRSRQNRINQKNNRS